MRQNGSCLALGALAFCAVLAAVAFLIQLNGAQ